MNDYTFTEDDETYDEFGVNTKNSFNTAPKKLTVNFKDLGLSVTKSKQEWIDELTEYILELAYQDGEYANGLLDDLLRGGFKGYWAMTDEELTEEIIQELESKYDNGEQE